MSRTPAPVVTGVSPKDGPPGTRITIRGENLGYSATDLIGLIICDCDCTLSAEWKSPNKIIARSGPGKGLGDIIATTRQGGQGTCTVKFRGYTEAIGPTKESAVWVDTPATLSWARRSLSPTSYQQQEDPLGLSVEASETTIPEDDLNELFPGHCGDLGSENFSPGWFLLENHHSTNFDDMKAGLHHMKRNIDNQKRGELSFLKANVSSVVDQLDTLNKLKDKYQSDAKSLPDFTSRVLRKIEETKEEAYQLFEEVLARRERADTTRNGLAVLQRFKFLFCLPAAIEQNVKKEEFDVIINEYARVKHMFGNTEIELFKKVLAEIETQIEGVRLKLLHKLDNSSLSLDEYMKIIRSLIHLEAKEDVAWLAIASFNNHLEQGMHELKDKYIVLETSETAKRNRGSSKPVITEGKPHRVLFVEELVDLMELRFPDLWKLGQAYFCGDFNVNTDPANPGKFKQLVLACMNTFCNLLRAVILPHSLPRGNQKQNYGTWPNTGYDGVIVWLPHCLRYSRMCHSCFTRIDLPSDALSVFSKLIFDLRLFIVTSLFRSAGEEISSMPSKEDWVIEQTDKYGGVTSLPRLWDAIVRRAVRSAHEVALSSDPREPPLMDQAASQKEVLTSLHSLFTSFAAAMETLGLVTDKELSGRGAVVSQLIGTAEILRPAADSLSWQLRLLIMFCNAQFTIQELLPDIFAYIQGCGVPCSVQTQKAALAVFTDLSTKLLDSYHEYKCDPLVGTIEPSMYLPKFDWDTNIAPSDVQPYAKEIIINLIGVRSELHRLPVLTVKRIMTRIVDTVAEELARLMSCVKNFSPAGAVQATADIIAVRDASKVYASTKSAKYFAESLTIVPRLVGEQEKLLNDVLENFRSRMALQLLCLT